MKRGFFIFEPVVVLAFLGALLIATFVTLGTKTDILDSPLGSHSATVMKTYTESENTVFLQREMTARYSVEDAVYQLAGGQGQIEVGTSCQRHGMPSQDPPSLNYNLASLDKVKAHLAQLVASAIGKETQTHYDFSIGNPFTVVGVPLQPEQVSITIPTKEKTDIGLAAYYNTRRSFVLSYGYQLEETYTQLKILETIPTCTKEQNQAGITQCVEGILQKANDDQKQQKVVIFSVDDVKDTTYIIKAEHQYQMPLCENKPVTKVKFDLRPTTLTT